MQVSPAYGRDYKSKKEVLEAWNAGKDFVIEDMFNPDCGRYVSKDDLTADVTVYVRYKKKTQVCEIKKAGTKHTPKQEV